MNEQELKQKLIEIVKNEKYDQIISTFSLEERIRLINIPEGLTSIIDIEKGREIFREFLTKEEAIQLYETSQPQSNTAYICIFCLPVEYKEKLLQKMPYDELYSIIVSSFENDELKMKYLKNIQNEWSRCYIINSFNDDQLKEKSLETIQNDSIKRTIIRSFKNDNLKEKYLDSFQDEYSKSNIITSFKTDKLKEKYLKILKEERTKNEIIKSLESDQLKEKYLNLIQSKIRKADIITTFTQDNLKIKYLKDFQEDILKKDIIKSFQTDQLKIEYLSEITDELEKIIVIDTLKSETLFWEQIKQISKFNYIKDTISHKELPDTTKVPIEIIKSYSLTYNIEPKKLNHFYQKFGYKTFKYLENKEIINILQLPDQDYKKIIDLFQEKKLELDEKRSHTIIESLLNREFRFTFPWIFDVFTNIEQLIEEQNGKELLETFKYINNIIPIENYLKKEEMEPFILGLFQKNKECFQKLHQIIENWIDNKKNEHVNQKIPIVNKELNLKEKIIYDKNFITKKVIATTSISNLMKLIESIEITSLTNEQLKLIENKSLLTEIIKFKKSPKEYGDNSRIKPYLKTFEKLFTILYQEDKLTDPTNDLNGIKKIIYLPKKVSNEFLLNILKELNIDKLKKRILSSEEEYNKLLEILDTYHILGIDNTYDKLSEKADVILDATTLSSLIENFSIIYKKLEKDLKDKKIKRINFISLVEYANAYGSNSYKYSMLFGKEDYRLISSNPPSNAAPVTKNERFATALEHVKTMYNRQYVTVPPIDKNIEVNNKKINIIVGNSTNMINLTYGERTGSCMRIGGAGDSLFKFCLENENGFHIRFSDPENNEFISRVSGFRNGNTIFLNQLRNSEMDNYTELDLVEACQIAAKLLIENSKDSKYPVDNVVISDGYAMCNYQHNFKKQNLGVKSIKEGFDYFYSDVDETAIILATSDPNGELVPVELGKEKVIRYPLQREKIDYYQEEKEIIEKISKLQIIDQLLKDIPFEDCNYRVPLDIKQCYIGQDWYLAIDSDGNHHEFIIEKTNNLEKVHEEINKVKEQIKNQGMVKLDAKKTRN